MVSLVIASISALLLIRSISVIHSRLRLAH